MAKKITDWEQIEKKSDIGRDFCMAKQNVARFARDVSHDEKKRGVKRVRKKERGEGEPHVILNVLQTWCFRLKT